MTFAYPSLKDYVGGQIKEGPGHAASHSEIVIQTLTGKTRLTQADGRCLITENHKYVLHQWGENREQLFDRKKDPGEEVNLALETRYQATLDCMRQSFRQWCKRNDDPFGRTIPIQS